MPLWSGTLQNIPILKRRDFSPTNSAMHTMNVLKALYDKNNFFERKGTPQAKIPKILHQIWVGPKTPPELLKQSQESFKKHNPDWEYKLWTDADVKSLMLHNQKFYDLSDNYGEKSDILRYELLHKFGGVYVDVDFICFKPLDVLCQYDLWAALEPLDCSNGTGINNAIIGSIPYHPILRHAIESIQETWYSGTNVFERVGPYHFKESFIKYAAQDLDNIIAFPKSFFYPLDFLQGMTHLKGNMDFAAIDNYKQPESFAMHLWAGSWRPSKGKSKKKHRRKRRQPVSQQIAQHTKFQQKELEQAKLEQARLEQAEREQAERERVKLEQAKLEQARLEQKEQELKKQEQREREEREQAEREKEEQERKEQAEREQRAREHREQEEREQREREGREQTEREREERNQKRERAKRA